MAEFNIAPELRDELLKAQSAQEAKDLIAAAGQDLAEEDAERVWEEIEHRRVDYAQELSDDELEAVAGGHRDKGVEGCAATVESDSWCWSNDRCVCWDVIYSSEQTSPREEDVRPRPLPKVGPRPF